MKVMAREGFAPHNKQSMDSVSEMNGGSLRCSHGERKEVLVFLLPCRVKLQASKGLCPWTSQNGTGACDWSLEAV